MDPLLVYQAFASVFVGSSLVNALADARHFRRPAATDPASRAEWPSLSVLIPARDEAAVIEPCVRSLLASGYPGPLEVIVVDDHSADTTAAIVAALASDDPRVRLLPGGPLLPGWKGKPNALRQLAAAATGSLVLLTDADCTFLPGSLTASVAHREATGADCLSLIPYLACDSFWEHVIVPLQYVLVFLTLPIAKITGSRNPAFAAANGAFLLLESGTYAALGGHESVRGAMAEDIGFAQHVKRSGRRLVYGDGARIYRVRMYTSLRGIWDGFSKNLFPAMGSRLPVLVVWSAFLAMTQILPLGFLAAALARDERSLALLWLPLVHVLIALGIRLGVGKRFGQSTWAAFLAPVGWAVTLAIGANSAYLALSGRGHTWKGRVYGADATPGRSRPEDGSTR